MVAVFSSSAAGERGARTAPSSVAMATVADAHTPAGGASVAGYTSATLTLTVQPPALDEQRQLHADPVSRLKRVTSSLSSLQTIQQALLRNSSLQNIVPTAHWTSVGEWREQLYRLVRPSLVLTTSPCRPASCSCVPTAHPSCWACQLPWPPWAGWVVCPCCALALCVSSSVPHALSACMSTRARGTGATGT